MDSSDSILSRALVSNFAPFVSMQQGIDNDEVATMSRSKFWNASVKTEKKSYLLLTIVQFLLVG